MNQESTAPPLGRMGGRRPWGAISRVTGWMVDHFASISLVVLLIGMAFPAAEPTADQVIADAAGGIWNTRLGSPNVFELLLLLVAAIWATRALLTHDRVPAFDRWLAFGIVAGLMIQTPVLLLSGTQPEFVPLDLERLLIPAAAYLVVTRSIRDEASLRRFTLAVGGVIVLRSIQLVLVYGLTGKTNFGTITGREALLITEDTLLLLYPVLLGWNALVEGRLTLAGMAGTLLLVGFTLSVDLLSLRRGALIMIGLALFARTIPIGWKKIFAGVLVSLVVFACLVTAGPARPIANDLVYAAKSALLLTKDDSTSQRTSEIKNFAANVDPATLATGKGIGAAWVVKVPAPVDAVAFGSGESEIRRIGWHVYGLDWLYKFGLIGIAIATMVTTKLFVLTRRSMAHTSKHIRSSILTHAVCVPPFLLFALTNLRVGLMAGICLGLLAASVQLAIKNQTNTKPTRSTSD